MGIPILLNPKNILLIGGGPVALQKATVLLDNDINTTLLSKDFIPEFAEIPFQKTIKTFEFSDLKGFDVVIDATGDEELSQALHVKRKEYGYLFNAVDIPHLCDFYFASLLKYQDLKILVSSNGASPTLTQVVREAIKTVIPKSLGNLNKKLSELRERGIIDKEGTKLEAKKHIQRAYLVGCGVGDADLLTLKALKIINIADVILYDHLISDEILELIPKETQKIYVGKTKGKHSFPQEEINQKIIDILKEGKSVARLKSGDPFVFGRGSEEAIEIINAGFFVEVVPGISSAISGPASGGIPVTARGFATSFSVVSAHLKDSKLNVDWLELLKVKNHTTVVLMGLSFASDIKNLAYEAGVAMDMPVAIVSNASRANQKVLTGSLHELDTLAKELESPAVIVFGDVVSLASILNFQENL